MTEEQIEDLYSEIDENGFWRTMRHLGKRLVNSSSIGRGEAAYLRGVGKQTGVLEQTDQRAEG